MRKFEQIEAEIKAVTEELQADQRPTREARGGAILPGAEAIREERSALKRRRGALRLELAASVERERAQTEPRSLEEIDAERASLEATLEASKSELRDLTRERDDRVNRDEVARMPEAKKRAIVNAIYAAGGIESREKFGTPGGV